MAGGPRRSSLQWRLSISLTVSLVLLFSLMIWAVSVGTAYLTDSFVATRLDHDRELLLTKFKLNRRGQPVIPPRHIPPIYTHPYSGHYYRIELDQQVLQSASQGEREFLPGPLTGRDGQLTERQGPDGQKLLVLSRVIDWQGRQLRMAIAEDVGPFDQASEQFIHAFKWTGGIALLLLVMLQAWIVRRGLHSLGNTRRELRALQHGELDRLSLEVPTEVRPVVAEVNELLDAINLRLERSRKALGNLTHALKTPLTLLGELARRPPPLSVADLQQELDTQVETMRQLMERELHRARLAGNIGTGQAFVADDEIPPLVDALQRMYHDKTVLIDTRIPPGLRCAVERQDLLELLGNLLDNACKWSEQRVRLTLAYDRGLQLMVEDDGPGLDAGQVAEMTGRGARLDEQKPGYGLGLGIVQDIVDGYGGEISFGRSDELGGLLVRVRLHSPSP